MSTGVFRSLLLCGTSFATLGLAVRPMMVLSDHSYKETVLHKFARARDAARPGSSLSADSSGALYGVTYVGGSAAKGTVFKLTPAGTTYTETVLYSFQGGSDGEFPSGDVAIDNHGSIYGTTPYDSGLNCGTAFKLTPNGHGRYTFSTVFTFDCGLSGGQPMNTGVILDKAGAIYGTTTAGGTQGNGVAYKLTPTASAYAEQVLHNFGSAGDGGRPNKLLLDKTGALYGTTENGDTVYKLTPDGSGHYEETILHTFGGQGDGQSPQSALVMDGQGRLFGTTEFGGNFGFGTAFELTPNGSSYTERIMHSFDGTGPSQPAGALVSDGSGGFFGFSLYGGPAEAGTAYDLIPSGKGYTIKTIHSFNNGKGGSLPYGTPSIDSSGTLYGVNLDDAPVNNGIVFKLTP